MRLLSVITLNKRFIVFLYICFLFLLFEGICQVGIRLLTGHWLWQTETYCYQTLFRKHPWLAVSAKPNSRCTNGKISFSFNSLGFRGGEIVRHKIADKKRIVCYGGSSTFCTQVSDNQTWSYYLQSILGDGGYEVINAGFPGYSSAEAVIQTALQQFDLSPDICIYYQGWNDIRNIHIKDLKSDYSDFHGPSQVSNLRLDGWLPNSRLACAQLLRIITASVSKRHDGSIGEISSFTEERALKIYVYNLKTLIDICKARNIRIIMIPQVLNYGKLISEKPYNWAPFIKEKDVERFMRMYNQAMIDLCRDESVVCIEDVLRIEWGKSDFVDEGHFSPAGNEKFAEIITRKIRDLKY